MEKHIPWLRLILFIIILFMMMIGCCGCFNTKTIVIDKTNIITVDSIATKRIIYASTFYFNGDTMLLFETSLGETFIIKKNK